MMEIRILQTLPSGHISGGRRHEAENPGQTVLALPKPESHLKKARYHDTYRLTVAIRSIFCRQIQVGVAMSLSNDELLERTEAAVRRLLLLPTRSPAKMSNDEYRASLKGLYEFSTDLKALQDQSGRKPDPLSLLQPLAEVSTRLLPSVRLKHKESEKRFNAGVPLPADAFAAEKEFVARWIGGVLASWTTVQRRVTWTLSTLSSEQQQAVRQMDAAANFFDIPQAAPPKDDEIAFPEPPPDIDPPQGALGDLKDYYDGLNPKPGIEFPDGGVKITLEWSCDWFGGGS